MVDVSDPALAEAYADVRNDKTDTDWVLCGYSEDGKSLQKRGSGSGGLAEMAESFVDNEPMYGYLRVTAGDEESIRQKFVLVTWCGPEVKALKKAKMSVHKASFKTLFKEFAVEMHYTERNEVDPAEVRARVIASGGANYSQKY
jgi:hypothetical protein